VGRDPTQKLTPRTPLAKSALTSADDETVSIRARRGLEPPPADPDDTLQLQPDKADTRAPGLAVAHEELETAFLRRERESTEHEETRGLVRDPVTTSEEETHVQKRAGEVESADSSGSDVGRAHAADETVAQSSTSSASSGSDVGRAHAADETVAQSSTDRDRAPAPRPPQQDVAAGAGWWEQDTPSEHAEPPVDKVKRASDRLRKRASGVGRASARVSARSATPGLGRRGRLVLGTVGIIGLVTLLTVLFLPDLFPPQLVLLEPTSPQVTGTRFVVRGRVEDATAVSVEVDGTAASLFTQGGSPHFQVVVDREATGPTTVVVEARDEAGNVTRRELAVECLLPHARLALTSPLEGASLSERRVLVAGRLETDARPGAFTVSVGELSQPVASDGSFQLWVPVETSPQTLRVVAAGGGAEAEATRTVLVDTTPPRLELIRPRDAITIAKELRVTARVYDDAPWVDVHVPGATHRVERGQLFSALIPLETLGERVIQLQAVDAAGLASPPLELVVQRLPPIRPRDFREQWATRPESWERYVLTRRLDPLDDRPQQLGEKGEETALSYPTLTEFVLRLQDWFYREAAIEALADQVDPVFAEALVEQVHTPETNPMVAEGLVRALAHAGDPAHVPALLELLDAGHKKRVVELAIAEALGELPDARSIPALIAALRDEDWPLVRQGIARSLEALTHHREPDAAGWARWWSANEASFSLATVSAEPPGPRLEPTTVSAAGVELTVRLAGQGAPVFVLPELGLETSYLEESLQPLEDALRLVYVTLPAKADFAPPLGDPDDPEALVPFPLTRFSQALTALREELVRAQQIADEPLTIVAHGTAGWLALDHARQAPDHVDRLFLVGTPPGREVWASAQGNLGRLAERIDDPELARVASAWLDVGAPPSPPFSDEGQALVRASWTSQFADTRRLWIGRLLGPLVEKHVGGKRYVVRALERPLVGLGLPEFSVTDLDRHPGTITLIAHGAHMSHYRAGDFELMAKRLDRARPGRAKALKFPRSALLQPLEENERFCATLRKLVLPGAPADDEPQPPAGD
jgi:pimeloyl-ACP methyl ester carboxylesterase